MRVGPCVCTPERKWPQKPEEGTASPEARVTVGCEPPEIGTGK